MLSSKRDTPFAVSRLQDKQIHYRETITNKQIKLSIISKIWNHMVFIEYGFIFI